MENSYVYIEEDDVEELTFRKIGRFFKKGWLRMVVYSLIALALAALVAVPIKVFYKTEPAAVTSIEFVYSGIENGKNPNGGSFNRDLIISPKVLSEAVVAAELSEKITEIAVLRAAMRVDSVPDAEYAKLVEEATNGNKDAQNKLNSTTYYPTRFDIVISEPSALGLRDREAINLLEKVVACYFADFADRYSVTKMFSADVFNMTLRNPNAEYTDVYDLYVDAISPIYDFVSLLESKSSAFVSSKNNATFASLLSEYNTVKLALDAFSNYVLVNNIWRDAASAKEALGTQKKQITNELTTLSSYVDALKEQIANIKPQEHTVVSPTGTTTTTTYPDLYYEYQDKLNAAQLQIKSLTDQLNNIEMRIERVNAAEEETSPDKIAAAKSMLSSIETQAAAFVNKVNNTVSDYYDTTVVSSSVRQVRPAMITMMDSSLNIVVILIAAFAVGLVIGGITTGVKISNAKYNRKHAIADEPKTDGKKPTESKGE
ncbi:MAG: hypothetical protein J1F39_03825 [Clostridiales bacterium]|nr:hypothetical protein [Clostridiales bacterium]